MATVDFFNGKTRVAVVKYLTVSLNEGKGLRDFMQPPYVIPLGKGTSRL